MGRSTIRVALSGREAGRLLDQAATLRTSGDLRGAIEIYTQLLRQYPIGELLNERAIAFVKCEDYDRAIRDLTRAIRLDNGDPDYYVNRGNAYLKSGDLPAALADYNAALELSPDSVHALNGRGQTHAELGRIEEATTDFKRAIELDREYASPLFNFALLLQEQGQLNAALVYLDEAYQLLPDDAAIGSLRNDIVSALEEYGEGGSSPEV